MSIFDNANLFAQASLSVILEATPFLLLGAVVSGLVEAFVPRERLERLLPRGRLASTFFGLALGAATPCCECGVVFLARRLLAKGVPPGAALAFMLAAPVINPISILATVVAFQGNWGVAAWRCGLVSLAAVAVGFWAGGRKPESLLRLGVAPDAGCACGCGHDHNHDHGQAVASGQAASPFGSLADAAPLSSLRPSRARQVESAMRHALADFLDMAKVLVFGAMAAAAFTTFVPTDLLMVLENNLVLSVIGMMGLAVVLSLCSQADAFVAASFASFPMAAKLAFMALGPMLDIKLVLMWRQVFTRRLIRMLALIPAAVILMVCLGLGLTSGIAS